MKKLNLVHVCLGTILLSILIFAPAYGQFSFKKIQDFNYFGPDKPLKFSTTPRYNRVEGVFLNIAATLTPQSIPKLEIYGDAGWGFENLPGKRFRYAGGIRKDFFDSNRLSLGAEVFKRVESEDDWVISGVENSLAAFFLREDFKDYYGTQGFEFSLDQKMWGDHTFRVEMSRITYDVLQRNTNWSVFGGDRRFAENPTNGQSLSPQFGIVEGDEIGIKLIAAFDWLPNPIAPVGGWAVEAIYERTFEDFETDGMFLTVKRQQPTLGYQRLFLRTLVGSRRGSLAEQHTIDLGGIGSLRGFDDKEFTGNRALTLSATYHFGGDVLQKIPLESIPWFGGLWSALSLGVFVDTGWTFVTEPDASLFDGFDEFEVDNMHTAVGFSLFLYDNLFRFNVAKRTDRSNNDFRITFRLLEKF